MPPLTPAEWRDLLDDELLERQPRIDLYTNYYNGNHRLQFATSKFREAFGDMFEAFATNWCALVVDVAVERLSILGFRFGEDDADEEAWDIWQANNLDAKSIAGHTEAVKAECAYLIVGPPRELDGEPVITVEHPSQVICAYDPSDTRIRLAALKKFVDFNGDLISVVWLPESVTIFRREGFVERLEALGVYIPAPMPNTQDWTVVSTRPNELNTVPVIPLENNPGLFRGGTSDLKPAIALNDAANKFFTDMIHASEFTSFPQRILTGVELPRDPITGDVLEEAEIRAAVSRIWAFEDPQANVHQLQAGDLSSYVEGIDLAVQHMAAQTRTPPHYLLARLVNLSGDALKAAETGLVARCKRKHIDFSDPWEEAMRLAFAWRALITGNERDRERAEMFNAETIWADPESRHQGQVGDALVKKKEVNVPDEILWEEAGYTPQQIKRMREMRAKELAEERRFERQQILQTSAKNGGGLDGPQT